MFKNELKKEIEIVNEYIEKYFPEKEEIIENIFNSMRYSLFAGGKRLRPILMKQAYTLCGGTDNAIMPFAVAIEMIHTYSLIHDDLPDLDNDDIRRGKPTNHKVFGPALAILTGDALLTYAFELASKSKQLFPQLNTDNILIALNELSNVAGIYGMVGGQVADIESENKNISFETLKYIHLHKTGMMIKGSLNIGAILANANAKKQNALINYGINIGLAFQIIDDILDVIGDDQKLGKPIGSDIELDKATYPKFLSIDDAKNEAFNLINKAKNELKIFGKNAEFLNNLADFIINRDY